MKVIATLIVAVGLVYSSNSDVLAMDLLSELGSSSHTTHETFPVRLLTQSEQKMDSTFYSDLCLGSHKALSLNMSGGCGGGIPPLKPLLMNIDLMRTIIPVYNYPQESRVLLDRTSLTTPYFKILELRDVNQEDVNALTDARAHFLPTLPLTIWIGPAAPPLRVALDPASSSDPSRAALRRQLTTDLDALEPPLLDIVASFFSDTTFYADKVTCTLKRPKSSKALKRMTTGVQTLTLENWTFNDKRAKSLVDIITKRPTLTCLILSACQVEPEKFQEDPFQAAVRLKTMFSPLFLPRFEIPDVSLVSFKIEGNESKES